MVNKKVSVVILNYNGKAYLKQFLPSVIEHTNAAWANIIVADNASTDDSVWFLQQNFPQVSIIQLATNYGYAKGYNEALKQVQAAYYVLLNSDVLVTSNWLDPIITFMDADSSVAACQPKILAYNNPQSFEYAGAAGGWLDVLAYPFCRGRVFETVENDKGQYDTNQQCFWASGAALFVRADLFTQIGGFDDYFFAHQEEIDLCWRLQNVGYTIWAVPASVVYHVGGGTLPTNSPRKTYLNFRNNLIMLSKNEVLWRCLYKVPFRFLLDSAAALVYLLKGKWKLTFAVYKAYLHYVGWLLFHKKQQVQVKGLRKLQGVLLKSVLWQYMVLHKKTFAQIVGKK